MQTSVVYFSPGHLQREDKEHDAQSRPSRARAALGTDGHRAPPGQRSCAWRGQGVLRPRAHPQQGGEEAEEAQDGQISIRARHQGAGPRGGLQRGLCGAEKAAPDDSTRQEVVQDRHPETRNLLHLLPQPRAGCLGYR